MNITTEEPKTNGQTEQIQKVPLDRVHVSEANTRHPKPAEVSELTQSMKEFGQTTPAIARPHPKKKGHFELAAGARRRVAAEAAGLTTLDVIVRQLDDSTLEETILIENLQREDPDPRAEVKLLDRLVKRGIATPSAISAHLGKPEHWVARRLKLLDVIPEVRKQWESDRDNRFSHYSVDMMELFGSLPKDTQISLFKSNDTYWLRHPRSRADLQKALEQQVFCKLSSAPFDLNDKRFFVKGCGPGCASDSSKQGSLFDMSGGTGDGRCLNCACFNARLGKWRAFRLEELQKANEIKKDLSLIIATQGYYTDRQSMRIGDRNVIAITPSYGQKIVYEKPKKGESQQVYVTNTTGTKFRVGYLVKGRESYSGGGGSSMTRTKPKKKSLETRKTILQSRRWDIVRKQLIDLVLASNAKAVTVDVIDLVPIFGFGFNCAPLRTERYNNKLWGRFDARKKKGFEMPRNEDKINYATCGNYMHHTIDHWSQRGTETIKDRNEAIWHGLKHVIIDQLLHFRLASEIVTDHGVTDIERIGKLMGFDTAKAKKEADLIIPPPKTWGKVDAHTLEPLK